MTNVMNMIVNPNCSEVVFELPGIARDDVISALRDIGIIEISMPVKGYRNEDCHVTVLADKDNALIPNASSNAGNFDIETWRDDVVVVHGGMNLGDYAYPTMLKIQQVFPSGKWDDLSGSDVEEFLQWHIHGMPPITTEMDEATKKIREKIVEPAFRPS